MNMRMTFSLFLATTVLFVPATVRARYLNTSTGRFQTIDTYHGNNQDPLSLHKYLYCHANPINCTDPTGREIYMGAGVAYSDFEPPARSWPPKKPFSDKILKKYVPGDFDEQTLDRGLDALKERFIMARDYLDKNGLEADAEGNAPGTASCWRANETVLRFMGPAPRGWVCFMDRAYDRPYRWLGGWDENFIHCYAGNKAGTKREIIFDWFEHAYHGNSGIFSEVNVFYNLHRYQGDQYPNLPLPTEKEGDVWKPKWEILDFLFGAIKISV